MQEPFDLGAPPPELPEGSSNLPDLSFFDEPGIARPTAVAEPASQPVLDVSMYSADMQAAINSWGPTVWGKVSNFHGQTINSLESLVAHIEAASKQEQAKPVVKDTDFSARFSAWQKECQMRKAWIESLALELHNRIAARKKALNDWDEYVDKARLDYQKAKATSPPPRPQRE